MKVDNGGMREGVTPFSNAHNKLNETTRARSRPKAPSPLHSAGALQDCGPAIQSPNRSRTVRRSSAPRESGGEHAAVQTLREDGHGLNLAERLELRWQSALSGRRPLSDARIGRIHRRLGAAQKRRCRFTPQVVYS